LIFLADESTTDGPPEDFLFDADADTVGADFGLEAEVTLVGVRDLDLLAGVAFEVDAADGLAGVFLGVFRAGVLFLEEDLGADLLGVREGVFAMISVLYEAMNVETNEDG